MYHPALAPVSAAEQCERRVLHQILQGQQVELDVLNKALDLSSRPQLAAIHLMQDSFSKHLGGLQRTKDGNVGQLGKTRLMVAAELGQAEVVDALLQHSPDNLELLNATSTISGYTALMYAAIGDHSQIASTLLRAGASAAIRNKDGVNVLDVAKWWGSTRVAALFS
jgi:ankyrin repeat protein